LTVKVEKFRSLSSIETRALERGKHRLQDYILGVEDEMEDIQEEIEDTRQKLTDLHCAHTKQKKYRSQLEGRISSIDEKLKAGKVKEGTDTFEDC
jgi:predicted  nucleic acid-binding Zn-ribbon protein